MWRWLHITSLVLAFAYSAGAGFSGIWTNGEYFVTQEKASQCYSASVERCKAANVAAHAPSFFDYAVGQDYAKLFSVKQNIKSCRPHFVKRSSDALASLQTNGLHSLTFSNDVQFLEYCSLPTNSLDETPWFMSEYPDVTGGWNNVYVMLTNMTTTIRAFSWFPTTNVLSDASMAMPFDIDNRTYSYEANTTSLITAAELNFIPNAVSQWSLVPTYRAIDESGNHIYRWMMDQAAVDVYGIDQPGRLDGIANSAYYSLEDLELGLSYALLGLDYVDFPRTMQTYGAEPDTQTLVVYNWLGMATPYNDALNAIRHLPWGPYVDFYTLAQQRPLGQPYYMTRRHTPRMIVASACYYEGAPATNWFASGTNYTLVPAYSNGVGSSYSRPGFGDTITNEYYVYTTNWFDSTNYVTNVVAVVDNVQTSKWWTGDIVYAGTPSGLIMIEDSFRYYPPEIYPFYMGITYGHGAYPLYTPTYTNTTVITPIDGVSNVITVVTNTHIYQIDFRDPQQYFITNSLNTNDSYELVPDSSEVAYGVGKMMVFNWEFIGAFTNAATMLYTGIAHKVDSFVLVDVPMTNCPIAEWPALTRNMPFDPGIDPLTYKNGFFKDFGLGISNGWSATYGTETNYLPYKWGRWWGVDGYDWEEMFPWFAHQTNAPINEPGLDALLVEGWQVLTNVALVWWDFEYK